VYLKPFEADMRHLIDTYIETSEPRKISVFDNMGLLEIILSLKACLHYWMRSIALRKAKAIEFNEFLKQISKMWRSGYRQVALKKLRYNWIPQANSPYIKT
jgi:hypothetical protein